MKEKCRRCKCESYWSQTLDAVLCRHRYEEIFYSKLSCPPAEVMGMWVQSPPPVPHKKNVSTELRLFRCCSRGACRFIERGRGLWWSCKHVSPLQWLITGVNLNLRESVAFRMYVLSVTVWVEFESLLSFIWSKCSSFAIFVPQRWVTRR